MSFKLYFINIIKEERRKKKKERRRKKKKEEERKKKERKKEEFRTIIERMIPRHNFTYNMLYRGVLLIPPLMKRNECSMSSIFTF